MTYFLCLQCEELVDEYLPTVFELLVNELVGEILVTYLPN